MRITEDKLRRGTLYNLFCAVCSLRLATYIVYIENDLINHSKDFDALRKRHKCKGA